MASSDVQVNVSVGLDMSGLINILRSVSEKFLRIAEELENERNEEREAPPE